MALTPEVEFEDIEVESEVIETSQTYKIDFENGRITNELITGLEATGSSCISPYRQNAMHIPYTAIMSETSFRTC